MSATVRDVMTTDVIAVQQDTPFKDMAVMLTKSRISAMPVVDEAGKVIGLVSEADLLVKEAEQGSHPGWFARIRHRRDLAKAAGITAADLMSSPPIVIHPDQRVQHAALIMRDRDVKRLPVVDTSGHLVGMVSRVDVLRVFGRADDEIRREVRERLLLHGFLVDPARFEVTVQDGIVTMAGEPETDEVGKDIIEAIRQLEGVVAVRDQLSYWGDGPRRRGATSPRA